MAWRFVIQAAKGGEDVEEVFPSACSWRASRAGTGSGSVTFQTRDAVAALGRDEFWSLLEPNDRMLSVRWGDHVSFLGVLGDWDYDRDAGSLTVAMNEFPGAFFPQRMTFGVNQYALGDLLISNKSRSGAVRAVLQRAMEWSAEWVLPIDLPADGAGSFNAEWRRWDTLRISDLLTQIEQDGTEIYFRPYVSGAGVRLQTLVAPKVTYGASEFSVTAPASPITNVKYLRSGVQQMTGLLGVGNGTGSDMLTAWAGVGGAAIPIKDMKREFKDIDDVARLQAATTAAFEEYRNPIEQLSFQLELGEAGISPEDVQVGSVVTLEFQGDQVIPDGQLKQRVIALSGDMGTTLTPEVQPHA